MLDFRIVLEARNPACHCSRHYRVEAGTDLFGVWVVEITDDRIGTAGRSRSYVLRDEGEARHLAQSILKRRASARDGSGSGTASASSSTPRGGQGLMVWQSRPRRRNLLPGGLKGYFWPVSLNDVSCPSATASPR